jgi:3-hydroxybutyryl-CoA dehydratase
MILVPRLGLPLPAAGTRRWRNLQVWVPPWFSKRCVSRHGPLIPPLEQRDRFPVSGTIPRHGHGMALNQYAEVRRVFTQEEVHEFGKLIGDLNPLHSSSSNISWDPLEKHGMFTVSERDKEEEEEGEEEEANNSSNQRKPLVHGILAGSVFSCIFGTLIPGSVYRHQALNFHQPIFVNDLVVGRVQVTKVRSIPRSRGLLVVCDTTVHVVYDDSELPITETDIAQQRVCIEGSAHVWLPSGRI